MKTLYPSPAKAFKKVKVESAQTVKNRIQVLLRQIAIKRDGGCVLRKYPEAGACGGYRNDGELILQAEHLNQRSRSNTYGDMRNIVCICLNHHFYFKKRNGRLYWELIRGEIGEKRWQYLKAAEADNRTYPMGKHEWLLVEISLKEELKKYL